MILSAFISIYLIGLLVFATVAEFGTPKWDSAFFLWQSISEGSVLAWTTIFAIGKKEVKRKVKWVLLLSVLKLAWEIGSLITGLTINNNYAVSVVFIVLVAICCYLTLDNDAKINRYVDSKIL